MDKIDRFLSHNPKYLKLSKPLESARVCDTARALARDRFSVVSFRDGLLTVGTENSSAAASLQMESISIIEEINQELKEEMVKKIRFKLT